MKNYPALLLVLLFVSLVSAPASAQQSAAQAAANSNPVSADLRSMYSAVKNNLLNMADKMPEEHYAFKATADVRTFGQLIGHVADSQARTCSMLSGEMKNLNASAKTSKADLTAALRESFVLCDKALEGMTDNSAGEMITMGQRQMTRLGMLARMISHSNEEYGYMAVYLRLKGIVPPSSERR